jgi:hypothetical protein
MLASRWEPRFGAEVIPTLWKAEWLGWDAERVIVPAKPGKAGGGKGPYFRSASEEAQVG